MMLKLFAAALILTAANADRVQACNSCGCRVQLQEAAAPAENNMKDHAHHHAGPLMQLAVAMYGQLGDQMSTLRTKAEGGCQDSKSTLRADAMHSVQSMLKALKDPETRKMVEMGMMLKAMSEGAHSHEDGAHEAHHTAGDMAAGDLLSNLETKLSQELEAFAAAQ